MRVLLVEDDQALLAIERRILTDGGYIVDSASTGASALELASMSFYDGIVLDLSLPDTSGLDVLRQLRRASNHPPVLFVTGQRDETIISQALNSGADDYVVKPLTAEHFLARVRTLLRRRTSGNVKDILLVGDLELNRLSHTLRRDGQPIAITRQEYALMEYLFLRPDVLVTRAELLEQVWGLQFDPRTNIIDAQIARVRRLLRKYGSSVTIETRRGQGFQLQVPRRS